MLDNHNTYQLNIVMNLDIFDLADIEPHTNIKIIAYDYEAEKKLIQNIKQILHAKYDVTFVMFNRQSVWIDSSNVVLICQAYVTDYREPISNIVTKYKFHNVIIVQSTIIDTCINCDLTFFPKKINGCREGFIYDILVDKKLYSFCEFKNIYDHYNTNATNESVFVIQNNSSIMQFHIEEPFTYLNLYYEDGLYYDKTINMINRIAKKYSIYNNIDGILYQQLLLKMNFIKKCYYAWYATKHTDYWLPIETYKIIFQLISVSFLTKKEIL